MTKTPLLTVSDLHVAILSHGRTVDAVDGVSFAIAAGRTLALVGESGSGKSMTAMSLLGLTPPGAEVSVSGTAMFDGRDLLAMSEAQLRRVRGKEIAVVFEDPSAALDPLMSISTQIQEALPADSRRGAQARTRISELLAEVGLGEISNVERRYPHELSGGQQQRVAIAIALAGDPSLLIADEPTTALDMSVQAQILGLLSRLQKARGMAMLLITHDLDIVANHADEVLVLRKGQMQEAGPTEHILAEPENDYTRMLLDRRPRLGTASAVAAARRSEPLLTVENLAVSYAGQNIFAERVAALNSVSFALKRGSALGIVGESGSGKSTLAKALVGLTPIDSGKMTFDGMHLENPQNMSSELRARVQYIFQDSYGALNPRLSVEKTVEEPFAIAGMPRAERRDAVLSLLLEVGLSEAHLARLPRELSGGQRQRVNIARALARSPELLICDEIVSALDVSIQAQVLDLLRKIRQTRSLTLLFISHDLAVVSELCEEVMVMKAGEVLEAGLVSQVFTNPARSYTAGLLKAARELESGPPTETRPFTLCDFDEELPMLRSSKRQPAPKQDLDLAEIN